MKISQELFDQIWSDELQTKLTKKINEDFINIPFINEEREAQIIDSVLGAFRQVLNDAVT